jgi:peptide methionine sulfoxide reductase MsrB
MTQSEFHELSDWDNKRVPIDERNRHGSCLKRNSRRCLMASLGVAILVGFLWFTGIISFDSPKCAGSIQPDLKYGCDSEVSLARSICCHNTRFAEPFGFQQQSHIALFSKLDPFKETIFYDSVCGIPLFAAPRGRTFQEWKAESLNHGWPSFRQQEVIDANIEMKAGGEVRSSCGVHLGHRFSDGGGARYCIDLVCIAGHNRTLAPGGNNASHAGVLI